MVRGLAKIAAASGLAAALATPLTLGALADTLPAGVSGAASPITSTVSGATATVTSSSGVHLPAAAPLATDPPADPAGQAPPGTATANAVSIAPLDTCISCTSAVAGPGSASANSTALRILGHDVSAGAASGNQQTSGDLIALPANPLLSLAIADWMASAQSSDTLSSAASRASLVDLNLDPGGHEIATLAVLEAGSHAMWTADSSSGSAYSNGVDLNLGNGALVIIVLHSDADSSGTAHTYVASINGNEILSNQQVGQPITITIPGVITITLLQTSATGGAASAAVGTVTNLLGMAGQQVGLFQVGTQGSSGAPSGNPGTGVQAASTGSEAGSLGAPETGAAVGIVGFLLAAGGAAAAAASRMRRRRAA
jgi:hypothetical protein